MVCNVVCAGFEFHHAQPRYVMMTLWLPSKQLTQAKMSAAAAPADGIEGTPASPATTAVAAAAATADGATPSSSAAPAPSAAAAVVEPSMIPAYASHSLGIGCLVLNSLGQCLVIQEKFPHPLLPDFWKLPGGAVDAGEELTQAAQREVLEETGVKAEFRSILGFRHLLNFRFGTGDLYFIAICAADESAGTIPAPTPQPEEISACKWWDLQEFLAFHSSRWMADLLREAALQEWVRMFPGKTLPPAPTAERVALLQTYPPHPQAAEGKAYPIVKLPVPPAPASSVGLAPVKCKSVLGKVESNFYVVSPSTPLANSNSSSSNVANAASKL